MNKPLVSLTIICYQAEKYIKEAIEGALAQTYSPLEIIFSDDASTDNTFAIIEEKLKDYSGPHHIVLNRNDVNMGIGAHVSKVWFDIAKGDWIIVSAGDDISLPHRVERLMQVAKPEIGALHHSIIPINENSEELPYLPEYVPDMEVFNRNSVEEIIKHGQWLKGATMCLNKKMLLKYGRINSGIVNEDNILAYRAQDFGGIIWLDEPLMKYRIHFSSDTMGLREVTADNHKKQIVKSAKSLIAIIQQIHDDSTLNIILSKSLLDHLSSKRTGAEIDLFLFDNYKFKFYFLTDKRFYYKGVKKLFFNIYWILIREKKKRSVEDFDKRVFQNI